MKKILAILMTTLMVATCFAGCAKNDSGAASSAGALVEKTDSQYVKDNGKLVVGITDFAPMDFEKDGEWVGFDADMAKAFAQSLGVDVEFVEIDWDYKVSELESKNIDCVWNGMTLTDEVKAAMSTSNAYCNNAQTVIVKKNVADKYKTAADCKELQFAVEAGSAGAKQAAANSFNYTEVKDQATALAEVKAGTCNAAIIDSLMAAAMVGEGTGYADLTYTVMLNSEEYGVGFRKGSDLTDKLNDFFKTAYSDGSMIAAAKKYGVQASLIEQK